MDTVVTARDFSMIFDAFSQFEESMITAKMEMDEDEDSSDEEPEEGDDVELDLRLARLENLMDRRPELMSSVKLRQNPNDVNEWRKRVKLWPWWRACGRGALWAAGRAPTASTANGLA